MPIGIQKKHLQTDKYAYTWDRDDGDGKYIGPKDRNKVDKDEGYEVAHFIEALMNSLDKTYLSEVHAAEDALHAPALRGVVMRDDLNASVKKALGW